MRNNLAATKAKNIAGNSSEIMTPLVLNRFDQKDVTFEPGSASDMLQSRLLERRKHEKSSS